MEKDKLRNTTFCLYLLSVLCPSDLNNAGLDITHNIWPATQLCWTVFLQKPLTGPALAGPAYPVAIVRLTTLHLFNDQHSRITWLNWYQTVKPLWVLLKQKMTEVHGVVTARTCAITCIYLQSDPYHQAYQVTNTLFLKGGCPSCCPTNSVKSVKSLVA